MLGFGFALFLMLVVLAVIYAQYVMRDQLNPATGMARPMSAGDQSERNSEVTSATSTVTAPLPSTVTPETVTDDLIDEALADRDDLSALAEDELADIEEGN